MLKYVKHYFTMLATVSCALTTIMSVTACDESVTESKGSSSVATVKDLGNCEASNEADLVYVKEAGAVYMCADGAWKSTEVPVVNELKVENCADSVVSCGVKPVNPDYKILSGIDSVKASVDAGKSAFEIAKEYDKTLTSEKDWLASLKGENGESCTGALLDNGNVKITCGKNNEGIIKNGSDGSNGTGCFIVSDKDGVVTLQCGEGENAKTTKLYKAICGTDPYDPEVDICVDQAVLGKCGTRTYEKETEFCYDGLVYQLCGDELLKYNPNREGCEGGSVVGLCGTKTFDLKAFACVSGQIFPLCRNESYNPERSEPYDPEIQECDAKTGTVTDKKLKDCGTKRYDPEIKFCDDRNGEYVIYKKVTIEGYIGNEPYSETWMTENLRYDAETGDVCRPDDNDYCTTYGRFYAWNAIIWEDENTGEYVDICPNGWELPSREQFEQLANVFGGPALAAKSLKSKEEWDGTNESGLNILPAGHVVIENGKYKFDSGVTRYWTKNYYSDDNAYALNIPSDGALSILTYAKSVPALVRCVMKKQQ